MAIHAGMRISSSWVVGTKIADGGMGSVWHVTHAEFGDRRALKAMHDFLLKDADLCARFIDEAKNTRKIRHPNVVEVFDAGRVQDPDSPPTTEKLIPWLVMELLDGHDLATEMEQVGADGLPWEQVATIFAQVAAGLEAAHAMGVVHLDLKPENLFLSRANGELRVKVVDFGISKLLRETGHSVTLTGKMLSPVWAAPEQIQRTKVSPRSDVWALGLIAFRMLTGRFYWHAANAGAAAGNDPVMVLVNEIVASFERPAAPSQRALELGAGGRLPAGFDTWFARCVTYDPSARFASARQCSEELGVLLGGVAHDPSLPPPRWLPRVATAVLERVPMPPREQEVESEEPVSEAFLKRDFQYSPTAVAVAAIVVVTVALGVSIAVRSGSISEEVTADASTSEVATPVTTSTEALTMRPTDIVPGAIPRERAVHRPVEREAPHPVRREVMHLGQGRQLDPDPPVSQSGLGSGVELVRERVVHGNVDIATGDRVGSVGGNIDDDAVMRLIRGQIGGIRGCYERELRDNPTISGHLDVTITIGMTSRVTTAASSGPLALAAPGIGTCIVSRLRGLVFPTPTGAPVDLSLPFTFTPGG